MLTAKCTPLVGSPFDIDYAIDIRHSQALQKLGTFEVRLVSSAEELAKYDYNDGIDIYIDSTIVFAGIIEKIVYNEREIVLSGRNTAVKLIWKITTAAKEYLDQYPDDVVKDLLSGTAISYDGGSIQHYDTELSYRFDRENKARAIAGVANSIGYEWWVEDDLLYFKEQRGQDKSGSITLSDDIILVDQSFDATKIIDKLTVVGMGPGSTHLEITVGTGDMEGVFSEKDIHDIDTLTTFANAALIQTQAAKHRVLIKLAGTTRTDIEVGDIVHIHHTDSGLDDDYRIISMARVSGVSGDFAQLEIAVPQFKVTEMITDLGRRADAKDYHPQGAPAILTLARDGNVDSTHSLKIKFYIPPEAVDMGKIQITEARVALTLEAFRAYSTGAASGGGHTSGASSASTTASGGQQTTSSGGGQTSSGGAAHDHGVSGQTAESAGAHRHAVGQYIGVGAAATERRFSAYECDFSVKQEGSAANISTYESTGNHTHSITGATSSSETTHTHTVSDHTHTVSDHTHGMEHTHAVQNHTHDIAYGIYESTSPADVYIKLNTVQIAGPFNADGYIDITTEFLNQITTYGWNTLELTTTQLGKIGATLFMRLFLQA